MYIWSLLFRLSEQIYDLKGSTRNRHVQSTGRENEVLLDENLVESMKIRNLQINLTRSTSGTPESILSTRTLKTNPTWCFI